MRVGLISVVFLVAQALAASAGVKGCYEQSYDAAYLGAHPGQTVSRIWLQYGFEQDSDWGEDDYDQLNYQLRGNMHRQTVFIDCNDNVNHAQCTYEHNGKALSLREIPNGVRFTTTSAFEKFRDGPKPITAPATLGNTTFDLRKISGGHCKF